ncbi:SEC59/DGK1/VTE5 family protein [Halobacteriovorax sp. GB3]|uniref:diacylglycerol/polyprenol kinase family protein n=1 Tax=Halobacteriovorax sp. GB3 TaxID=2719615 RepID=UPI00235F7EA4|nr:diacylglycerol/polyprenol kinase family protein [Halobacteriovorax sp. GB3]MDD0851476.1 SEC59/DGK1/VTE5 family protein [Halobacteriovorax sp. GB3]
MFAESTRLHKRSDLHIVRKLWHITSGLAGLYAYYSVGHEAKQVGVFLMGFAIFAFIVELIRIKAPALNSSILKVMGPFMRESERNSLSGLPFFVSGVGLSLYLFDEEIAILSIFFLTFSDPLSSLVGILYGKDKILPNKSLQGSVAGFICCYFCTLIYGLNFLEPNVDLLIFATFAGVIGSVSELCSVFIDDNFTIPVISGLGLTLLNNFVPIF